MRSLFGLRAVAIFIVSIRCLRAVKNTWMAWNQAINQTIKIHFTMSIIFVIDVFPCKRVRCMVAKFLYTYLQLGHRKKKCRINSKLCCNEKVPPLYPYHRRINILSMLRYIVILICYSIRTLCTVFVRKIKY